jgi:acyl transferase domain-containing protein/NAD(P)H-dependent flavin oxidoreductase YrpB (nitropropane dioxygenase family)/acyl carrier protein
MNSFNCFSLNPIELEHPGIAVATIRAGGVGVLDTEFCSQRDTDLAVRNLDRLLDLVNPDDAVGLRLRVEQIAGSHTLLKRVENRPHWLILCGWKPQEFEEVTASLLTFPKCRLLLEVTEIDQALALPPQLFKKEGQGWVDGLVAKGHESGGWVGEDSAFLLTQKLVGTQPLPVYVQGGIGIHTVAACRAAGAAGVVLDDQLWLMPESPFPKEWQRHLSNLSGQEAILIGERLAGNCRVLSRPGFQVISALQKLAEQLELQDEPLTLLPNALHDRQLADASARGASSLSELWRQQAHPSIGWGSPGILGWPMGQAVGLAASVRDRYKTTGRFVQALLQASEEHIKIAQTLRPLQPNAPLAVSHKTKYPIVQGPMTRVSDSAEFADAVSQGGALPLLALALMRGEQVRALLQKTKARLNDRSWGIGILGFVPQAVREEQLKEVKAVKPPFALIAGGRPDQAAQLEAEGIATYLHVPVPALLKLFLEQGARRFVFEGRECGGHVGPLSSFLLWESTISTLLEEVPVGAEREVQVLFAGGIHDARSAAMVGAMAAPLVERGMQIGVLMGSAYLFTEEAVSCGAIVKGFQEQAIACTRTINLETGPGHASRCAVTPFAREFYATRRQLAMSGSSPEEIKNALENLTLGRLRIASKGLMRTTKSQPIAVDEDKQIHDGMYMIGQVATLRNGACNIKALHEDVSETSTNLLVRGSSFVVHANERSRMNDRQLAKPSDIAIIGISTLLPEAQHQETFWENILRKVNAIAEIPSSRWDWRLYYDCDRNARDKIYSKWGGFLEDVPFDPIRFGIPPKSLKSIEPMQLLTLEAVRRALDDAGLAGGDFDRENTSVILGASGGLGDLGQQYAARCEIPRLLEAPSEQIWDRLPEWTEDSFPGMLLNAIAGRVTNRFDLGGSNYTVDAACASSLAAIDLAVKELESGRSNVAIAGGVDTIQSPMAYMCFSKTQALSPHGQSRTFDKNADGIAISEGIAIVVLKRLADAERDGDRIYAVIKAVAGSSDGKALGLTAPLPTGQMRAVKRAYHKAGFSPNTLGLYEAHGTGTVAGDKAELETIINTLETEKAASKSCAIGSVKSAIGHTKSTAGVAGLIKVTLALHYKTLPPHLGVDTPLDPIAEPESPVYLVKEAQPWLANPDYPRRAGVSAFGFGGTNFHAVLEEYRGNLHGTLAGAETWPYELFVWRAPNRETLAKEVQSLLEALQAGAEPRLRDLAYSYARQTRERQAQNVCLSIVVESLRQLREALNLVLTHLTSQTSSLPPHIQLNLSPVKDSGQTTDRNPPTTNNKIAFLFPGQGAQYPDMAREVALYFQEMRSAVELADRQLRTRLPKRLSQFIYPPSAYSEAAEEQNKQLLTDTHIAQPAIGAVEVGYLDLLKRLGLEAQMVAGHSYGEYTALHAAGVLSREAFFKLSETRGRVMSAACAAADGAMAAVQATREELLARLAGFGSVVIANHNAPLQSVISGEKKAVRQVVDALNVAEIMARMLPVAGAFHSSLVASAQASLSGAIASASMQPPKIPIYANSTARPYDTDINAIRSQLSQHLLSPVEFVGQINAMYEDGARVFVEVGPKSILTKLVGQILADRNHTVVSLDGGGGGLKGLLIALGTLAVRGVDLNLTGLFKGRDVQPLDLSDLVELTRKPQLAPTTWLLNGGSARPQSEVVGYAGKLPPLSLETAARAIQEKERQEEHQREEELRKTLHPTEKLAAPVPPAPTPTLTELAVQSTTALPMSTPTPEQGASQPSVPPALLSDNHQAPTSGDAALMAYQAYQQTMRQFLTLQEQVMQQFLGSGSQMGPLRPQNPAAIPTPMMPDRQPHATNGKHNGNGAATNPTPVPKPRELHAPKPVIHPEAIESPTVEPLLSSQAPAISLSSLPDTVSEATPQEPAEPNPVNRTSLLQILLRLVSDRTGYPIEMLGLDQDLEAELGIDSIKRVEILGALQKNLPDSLAASIRERMENLTRVKSLNGIAEQLLSPVPTAASAPAPSPQMPTAQPLTPGLDKTALIKTLLRLVSDRTGYPIEMLGLDQDLEAELGIDSIKRVEILGALQKSLPASLTANVQSKMESLTRVKSLNGIVAQLESLQEGKADPSESSQHPSTFNSITPTAQEASSLGKLTAGGSPLSAT